jgi:hypothetical protein
MLIFSFAKLREEETAFHDKIMTLAMQEMLKYNKNELEYELSEEAKNVKEVILHISLLVAIIR